MNHDFFRDAACRDADTNLFFPSKGEMAKIQAARNICASCPVRRQCRDYSFDMARKADLDGIFGGLTKYERQVALGQIRRRIHRRINPFEQPLDGARQLCGSVAGYNRHKRDFKRGIGNGPCQACRDAYAQYHLRKRAQTKRARRVA